MKLQSTKTAVLTLDLQMGILARGEGFDTTISNAAKIVNFARQQQFHIIHIGLGFSEGHPEIKNSDNMFNTVKQNNLFVKESKSSQFHPLIVQTHDLIIYKQRVSAFSENHLNLTLRSLGIENLVLFGIATSGIVLSTVTQAFDLDFNLVIIQDACFDPDIEVHKIFYT